jgi:hypothetical protein
VYFSALKEEAEIKIKDFGPKVEGNFLNSACEREHIYVWSFVPQKKFYQKQRRVAQILRVVYQMQLCKLLSLNF